jgi:transposase
VDWCEVSDELWERLKPLLPQRPRRRRWPGRKPLDDRACRNGILFVLWTGIRWDRLPQQLGYGSGMTCWRRLRDWQRTGVWQQLHHLALDQLGRASQLDRSRASLDSLSVRAKHGGPDRSQSGRPRQARVQVPPADRPARHPPGGRPGGVDEVLVASTLREVIPWSPVDGRAAIRPTALLPTTLRHLALGA